MRKNKVEIFFVLYLTALVGFVVVSKERDKHDIQIERQKNEFLHSFLKPVPVRFQHDTLWWYVDAIDGANGFTTPQEPLVADLKVFDIGPIDSVTVKITSVTHNNLLVSPRLVTPLGRMAYGELNDRIVQYPLSCDFAALGVYTVSLEVKSRRFHPIADDEYLYRDITFPKELLPKSVLDKIEETHSAFTVIVEDTSLATPVDVPDIKITAENESITSALGFQETNEIHVNLGFYNPRVRIVSGPGTLQRVAKDSKTETYLWTGPVEKYPYDAVIEARVDRNAGGKDIGRVAFTVAAELPYLVESKPGFAYSGETFEANVQVQGLEDENAYTWELYEDAGSGALLSKLSGKGPIVRYHVPTGFSGKKLLVQAKYNGRPYVQFDRQSGIEHTSRFVFPVIDPPVHIVLADKGVLLSTGIYQFTAYRYSQLQYKYDQPVMNLDKVQVQLTTEEGERIQTNIRMNSPGRFEFAIVYPGEIPAEGFSATLRVDVDGIFVSRAVRLKK